MTKRMLIDSAHPEETRVVLLDGNQLEDFDVEVSSRRQLKGNIYLAKVIRVEPSLQAAFVDYGGNRHGFLAFSEIHPDYYQIPVSDREDTVEAVAEEAVVEDAPDDAEDVSDDDAEVADDGKSVEVIGGDDTDDIEETQSRRRPPAARHYKIQEVIKRRQVLLIQVVKEERGNKGAALTTYMSLAGRYCVLMPNTARGGGISRKITNTADRKALKEILGSLEVPEGMAVILRTAGIGRTKAEIKRDFEYLIRLWNNVRDVTLQSTAPTLVHEEGDIVRRSIRDLYSRDIEEVQVQGEAAYKAAKEFMKLLIPSHARRVKLYKDTDAPLLRHYGVEHQMDAMHNPIVNLPSGGYLVINPTEALVSVDVNSGKSTKERNIEETAVKTNLEAADALARQLRLRDLAGLIVIDFIDMDVNRNNAQVERRMKEALKNDRARIQVGRISPFGLLEMSRQRLRPSLIETSSEPCPYCAGTGIRRSTESTALVVLRAIDEEGSSHSSSELTVHVPTPVALYILNHKREALVELERKHSFHVVLTNDDSLIPPDLRLERTKNNDGDTISEMVAAQRIDAPEEAGRKRRRRRGGRNRNEGEGSQTQSKDNAEGSNEGARDGNRQAQPQRSGEVELDENGVEKPKRRRRSRRGGRNRGRNRSEVITNADGSVTPVTPIEAGDAVPTEPTQDGEAPKAVESGEAPTLTDGEERPKRRRPRRRRSSSAAANAEATASTDGASEAPAQAEEPTQAPVEVSAEASAQTKDNAEETAKPAPKPRRARSPRKKPEAAVAQGEPEAASVEDTPAKPVAEKPKRARAPSRAKKVEEPKEKVAKVATPKPTKSKPMEPKPAPGVIAPGVTVTGNVEEKPKRKGWWNIGS